MTYQADFVVDRHVQTAIAVGRKHKKSVAWMRVIALALFAIDERRATEKGKRMSDGHLTQVAAELTGASCISDR